MFDLHVLSSVCALTLRNFEIVSNCVSELVLFFI